MLFKWHPAALPVRNRHNRCSVWVQAACCVTPEFTACSVFMAQHPCLYSDHVRPSPYPVHTLCSSLILLRDAQIQVPIATQKWSSGRDSEGADPCRLRLAKKISATGPIWTTRKISPPPGFHPRTVQPVASRCSKCVEMTSLGVSICDQMQAGSRGHSRLFTGGGGVELPKNNAISPAQST